MNIIILTTFSAYVFLVLHICVQAAEIQFCDGDQKIEKSREQCSSGITFGSQRPDCICIKGIYRLWSDNCQTADGFAEQVCTKLTDHSTRTNIVALKLTRDPINWSQTGVVCEKKNYGAWDFDFITSNSKGSITKNSHVYVMNGKAFWDPKGKGGICVQSAVLPENKKICKYAKKDNSQHWRQSEIQVEVRKECKGLPALKESVCFGVLRKIDSECDLPCRPKSLGRSLSSKTGKGRSLNDKLAIISGKGPMEADASKSSPMANPLLLENLTNPADYRRHDNKFLNRKMLIYNIISQIEESPTKLTDNSTAAYGQPNKTFELFDMMKEITKKFCPNEYVNPDWIDMVVNLFYILHKGNVFQYSPNLLDPEYIWIKSILTTCLDTVETIDLMSTPPVARNATSPEEPIDPIANSCPGKATGYCNGSSEDTGCNYKPVTPLPPNRANASFHYVPDVAWDIVDLIQVACFDSFNVSYRMFHVLEQASEKLFSLQIRNLWYFPSYSVKTKTKLLGAAADLQVHNLEVCIESAYDRNGQIPRLQRLSPPKYLRKKRAVSGAGSSIAKRSQVYCGRTKKDFTLPKKCQR